MTDKWSYSTPYGRWAVQRQPSGVWAAAYRATSAGLPGGEFEAAVRRWRGLDDAGLPRLHSVGADDRQVNWVLPPHANWTPLAAAGPLAVDDTRWLVREAGGLLEAMHHGRAAALDLAPNLVLVDRVGRRVTVLPTLGLDRQAAAAPDGVTRMPFVAPEVGGAGPVDPARADVYGLGALAWWLLTGRERKATPGRLPSELDPGLAGWDAFVDGCCRSAPARRFAAVGEAGAAVAGTPPAPSGVVEVPPPSVWLARSAPVTPGAVSSVVSRRRVLAAGCLGVAAVTAATVAVRPAWLAGLIPGADRALLGYERGFADTVLKYKDRSYDGAAWRKLQEADSLSVVAAVKGRDAVRLHGVAGWDDDNFWVTGCSEAFSAVAFRYRGGHWSAGGEMETNSINPIRQRVLDPDTLAVATGDRLYELSPKGRVDLGRSPSDAGSQWSEICPVAPDLYYLLANGGSGDEVVSKVADGRRSELAADKHKECYVHRADNTPLKDYRVSGIKPTRALAAGRVLGVHGDRWGEYRKPKLAEYRDGIWYDLGDLPTERVVTDLWVYAEGGSPRVVAAAGRDGVVYTHPLDGGRRHEIAVSAPPEGTSLKLLKVWGVRPDRFWVMDTNGTVWERAGTDWRVVVRGLYRDDVEFVGGWVSPTGAVVAVTDKHVYRLG